MYTRSRGLILAGLIGLAALLLLIQPAGSTEAEGLGSQWLPSVNGGLNGPVFAIARLGNDVYVGGKFTATKDGAVQGLNRIAKFSNGQWSALPNDGLDGIFVKDIVVVGDELCVGGFFSESYDGAVKDLNNIAVLANGQWEALPNKGVLGQVNDLEVKGSELYVGGLFSYTGDYSLVLNNIAKLTGGVWSALPNKGLDHEVKAVKWFKDDLYAGGFFTKTKDNEITGIKHFAKLKNGIEWVPVSGDGLDDDVLDMTVYNNRLVLGGRFVQSADGQIKDLNRILFWNGSQYERLANDGLQNRVEALLVYDGILFVGGAFVRTADSAVQDLNYVAMYRNNLWSPLPNKGMNGLVYALGVSGGSLALGGSFSGTSDKVLENSWSIAEMNLGANLKMRQQVGTGSGPREFRITLSVTNRGPNSSENVKVIDAIPAGYAGVSATTPVGSCGIKKGKVRCDLGTLTLKQTVDIDIVVKGNQGTPVVTNCGEASSSTYDSNPNNQKACSRIPPN